MTSDNSSLGILAIAIPLVIACGQSSENGGESSVASSPLSSAGSGRGTGSGANGETTGSGGAASTRGSGGVASDPSAVIYDPNNLPHFHIELPQASIDALKQVTGQDDPRQETYVTATLKYGTESVSNIGLRIKGEGSFQNLDRKPAWKIKFDEFVAKQEFHGLRRLTLNNLSEDPSFIAERLAYDVYRAAGVAAPRCNNALVYINGTFYGVYANVEAEDKTFLRRWFSDDGGNLYEEGQQDFVTGAETAWELETNESANDRTDMKNAIAAIQAATNADTFLQDIGAVIDTTQFLRLTALEAAVNQWDTYAYTRFWVNNFRVYADPTTKKLNFIPWGHDLSMKPFRDSGKDFIRLLELAHQFDKANGPVSSGLLFQRCLKSAGCITAYKEAVREIIKVYDGMELEIAATRYYGQVRADVYKDTRKNICCTTTTPSTNEQFETAFQSVLTTIRGRTAAMRKDLGE